MVPQGRRARGLCQRFVVKGVGLWRAGDGRREPEGAAERPDGRPHLRRAGECDGRYLQWAPPGGRRVRPLIAGKDSIGAVNGALGEKNCILVAPGRAGSSNPLRGMPVRYDELTGRSCIVEVGFPEEGYMPERSFGTHFFTDLKIDGILSMPVHTDGDKNIGLVIADRVDEPDSGW